MDLKIIEETPPWEWPEDTNKFFLDILRNNQAEETDRLLAAELTGDFTVINDELVDILLSILQNGNESNKTREEGQPRPGTVEDAAQAIHRASLLQVIRQKTTRKLDSFYNSIKLSEYTFPVPFYWTHLLRLLPTSPPIVSFP
ncbi:MAG: aerolysin family beta-barrel pore-forming toxin [Deltaproteobacteria bacterium]|nr:aerolysin family beta-barrel pore-forming toxin [Deltaproteobacteria bacterium]